MPADHRGAERVVDAHHHRGLRRLARGLEDLLVQVERAGDQHRRGREVAHHELVALLGELRGGGDVDDERDAALLGDLGDGDALARVEGADQHVGACRRSPFRPGCAPRRAWSRCRNSPPRASPGSSCRRSTSLATSAPRRQAWPICACTPEVGRINATLTLAGADWAEAKRSGNGAPIKAAPAGGTAEAAAGKAVVGHVTLPDLAGRTIERAVWAC